MNKYRKFFRASDFKNLKFDEPLKNHTSFKIGGPADVLIAITSEEELISALEICRKENLPYFIMGNGSNLLVRDGGLRKVVIKINEGFDMVKVENGILKAQAGSLLSSVSKSALRESLAGIEFASGIPGTIGGAIIMNAGAYGGEMKDIVRKVRVMNKQGAFLEITNEEMDFRYRDSRANKEGWIVLSVELDLKPGKYEEIEAIMKDLTFQRTSKQPLELPSGGSTFKRPEGYYAGKLIEDAGLKGLRHGDAQISDKHCGFVVNRGASTYKEVMELIEVIQKTVRDKFGVELEMEIKQVGEE